MTEAQVTEPEVPVITTATPARRKVLVATPCYAGGMTVAYHMSALTALRENLAADDGIDLEFFTHSGESLIVRARNAMASRFLEGDWTDLLFIDADIEFTYEHIVRLVRSEHAVAAQPYPLKRINWGDLDPNAGTAADLRGSVLSLCGRLTDRREGDFVEAHEIGTGFMLIRRWALEALNDVSEYIDENSRAKVWGFFDLMYEDSPELGGLRALSEDYAFCRRWQKTGGRVMVDMGAPLLTHHGSYAYGS